jgi:hypothetical protein
LVVGLLGESNGEHSDDETIGSLGLHESFNKGVPFLNHSACMIPCDVNSVKVSVAIVTFHLLNLELNLSVRVWVLVRLVLLALAISEVNSENTPFQTISRVE